MSKLDLCSGIASSVSANLAINDEHELVSGQASGSFSAYWRQLAMRRNSRSVKRSRQVGCGRWAWGYQHIIVVVLIGGPLVKTNVPGMAVFRYTD